MVFNKRVWLTFWIAGFKLHWQIPISLGHLKIVRQKSSKTQVNNYYFFFYCGCPWISAKKEGWMPVDHTCAGCHGNSRAREGLIASSVQRFCYTCHIMLSRHWIYMFCLCCVIFISKVDNTIFNYLVYVNGEKWIVGYVKCIKPIFSP